MPVSKAQQKAVHKYVKANYDRMELTVPKGRKEIIQSAAASQGQSVNAYINQAIDERMNRDAPQSVSDAASAEAAQKLVETQKPVESASET